MHTRSKCIRCIAMLLSAVMVFCAVPMVAFASTAEDEGLAVQTTPHTPTVTPSDNVTPEGDTADTARPSLDELYGASAAEVTPLYELTERRDAYTKHIYMSDGSTVAAVYRQPVHIEGEDGTFTEINNTLAEARTADGELLTADGRIKLAKHVTGNGRLYTLKSGSRSLSLSLVGAVKGTVGTVTAHEEAEADTELAKMLQLSHLNSSVTYADILPGVDIEYVLSSLDIKENIIVKERTSSFVYTFTLDVNGLTATLGADGGIRLLDSKTGEVVYDMPAPVVFDAAGSVAPSGTAAYALTDHKNGKYTLTVTADPTWMLAAERVYPITVDPTVGVAREGMTDVYVSDDAPTVAINDTSLRLAHNTTAYLHFPSTYFPKLGRGVYVSEANLRVVAGLALGDTSITVDAHRISTSFTVSENGNGTYAFSGGAYSATVLDAQAIEKTYPCEYRFNITPAVRNWIVGTGNYGIALRARDVAATESTYVSVYSSEHVGDTLAGWTNPCLEITYIEIAGLEDYYPTEAHSVGAAGSGSIQLAGGALTFLLPTLSTTDSLLPAAPSLVYNSTLAGRRFVYGNSMCGYTASPLAYGFQLSLQESIVCLPGVDQGADDYHYVYVDGDGTSHYFTPKGTEFVDNSALGRSLAYDSTLGAYVLTYRDGTKKYFARAASTPDGTRAAWHLCKIEDTNGNALLINVNSLGHPTALKLMPSGVSEANAIEMLTFVYQNNVLRAICNDTTGDAVLFGYATSGTGEVTSSASEYLRTVAYAHSDALSGSAWGTATSGAYTVLRTTELTYASGGCLASVFDTESKRGMRYTWRSDYRLTGVTEYATGTGSEVLGQSISITTKTGFAEVRSAGADDTLGNTDDVLTRYTLDKFGRAITVYSISADGKTLYGATSGEYATQENAKNSLARIIEGGSTVNYIIDGGFEKDISASDYSYWARNSASTVQQTEAFENAWETGNHYSVAFSPTADTPATVTQALSLPSGDYAVSFLVESAYCDNVVGTVTVTNAATGAVLHTDTIPLNTDSTVATEERFTTDFTVPTSSAGTTVLLSISFTGSASASSSLRVDNVTLTAGERATEFSLVQNGGFEPTARTADDQSTYSMTEFWSTGFSSPSVSENYALQGEGGLQLSSSVFSFARSAYQTVFTATETELAYFDLSCSENFDEDAAFLLSGFAKLSGEHTLTKPFRLRADVYYYQGEGVESICKSHYLPFQPEITDWQYASLIVPLRYTPSEGEDGHFVCVEKINVYCEFSNDMENSGKAWFDNISFVPLTPQNSLKQYYDVQGRLSATESANGNTYYEYNDRDQVTRVANDFGEYTDYVYSSNGYRIFSETYGTFVNTENKTLYPYQYQNPNNHIVKTPKRTTYYTYNDYGQCTRTFTTPYTNGTASGSTVTGQSTYTEALTPFIGQLLTETDSYGNTVRYLYDSEDGKLLATVDAKGNATVYQYDSRDRLVGVRPGTYTASTNTATADTSNTAERVLYSHSNDNGMLASVTTGSTVYSFTYDAFGNTESTQVGGQTVASYEYNPHNGKLKKITYANGFSEEYAYTDLDRVEKIWYTQDGVRTEVFRYAYTDEGQLLRFENLLTDEVTHYRYDSSGRLISVAKAEDDAYSLYSEYTYDEYSDLRTLTYTVALGAEQTDTGRYTYEYNSDRTLHYITTPVGHGMQYSYDSLDRLSWTYFIAHDDGFRIQSSYTYKTENNSTGLLVSQYTNTVCFGTETVLNYTYDENGNITEIVDKDGKKVTYTYDDLNQLLTERNEVLGKSYVYEYDEAGNRTSVKVTDLATNAVTIKTYAYTHGTWGDALTSYNGTAITYDALGNPLQYYNGNTFAWDGRTFCGAWVGPGYFYAYTYDDEGRLTQKTGEGFTTDYVYDGDRLIAEMHDWYTIVYVYDHGNVPIGMKYRATEDTLWTNYWFEKNLQGDIIAIWDNWGVKLLSYTYDAWGNHNYTVHYNDGVGGFYRNNFRYRGYYYDSDLGLYRTQTRLYDPVTGRFISPDSFVSTGQGILGNNMYLYCGNDPVNRVDPSGEFWLAALITVIAAVCTVTLSGCSAQPTSDVGSAQPYVDMPGSNDPKSPNCYAYAIGSPVNEQPGGASGRIPTKWNDVNDVGKSVKADLKAKGYTVRKISGPDAKVYDNEFKIALRVGTQPYAYNPYTGELYYDYHFMRQTDTGQWAEKHGYGGSSYLWSVGMNPDTIPWTLNGIPYYDSPIIYYAVGR